MPLQIEIVGYDTRAYAALKRDFAPRFMDTNRYAAKTGFIHNVRTKSGVRPRPPDTAR